MSNNELEKLAIIRDRHLALVEAAPQPAEILIFIEYTRRAGADIRHTKARSHLNTMLRHWAYSIYRQTGTFPETMLEPARC